MEFGGQSVTQDSVVLMHKLPVTNSAMIMKVHIQYSVFSLSILYFLVIQSGVDPGGEGLLRAHGPPLLLESPRFP